jgi:hypothetical protein
MSPCLRPYQLEIAAAVLDSVFYHKGLTFSVEIARQGGKNELSARLERLLLVLNMHRPLQIVKCSPTFKPQTVISMMRLKDRLNDAGFNGAWTSELGYIIRLGEARAVFLSADMSSNVVGNTAHLLLEVDESQDVDPDKFTKEFKPMGASTNCTVVHYGTTWDDSTLLESVKQTNLELEKKDGVRRHFRCDYQEVGRYNPEYLINVEMERQRLGDNHPLFLTQYRLLPLHGGAGFLNHQQLSLISGSHTRHCQPENGKIYVAGIDLAGQAETEMEEYMTSLHPRRDSTVVTIGEVEWHEPVLLTPISPLPDLKLETRYSKLPYPTSSPSLDSKLETGNSKLPFLRIVEHYRWTGEQHASLYPQLVDLLKNVWHCKKVVVDATGVGEPVAAFLKEALGHRIVPFKFTTQSKSELAFNLLAVVNSGRLKMYAPDGSSEYQEMWFELNKAKSLYRPNRTLNFFVGPSDGHDDFLMSLALLVESASFYKPRIAWGRMAP